MSNLHNKMTCQKRRLEDDFEKIEKIGQCTNGVKSSSNHNGSTRGTTNTERREKFPQEAIAKIIDTKRTDLAVAKLKLENYLKDRDIKFREIIIDLIFDTLKNERYPDPKVILCDLDDIRLCSRDRNRKLIKFLWDELTKGCDKSQHQQHQLREAYHQTISRDRDKYDRYSTSGHSYSTSSSNSHSRSLSVSPTHNHKASSSMHH